MTKPVSRQAVPPPVAYFSMEIGLEPSIPTYSGGLGVLAGDTLRAAADLNVIGGPSLLKEFVDDPVVAGGTVTLEFTLAHSEFAGGDATDITFTDDLAAVLPGLTAIGPLSTGTCDGTLTSMAMDTSLLYQGGTLAPGETCSFSVSLDVPAGAAPGAHTNTTSTVLAMVGGLLVTRTRQSAPIAMPPDLMLKAERELDALGAALSMFRDDCGRYPSGEEGLDALLRNPGITGWDGHYITLMRNDPWKEPYRYSVTNGTVTLFSSGPDTIEGTDDDVYPSSP